MVKDYGFLPDVEGVDPLVVKMGNLGLSPQTLRILKKMLLSQRVCGVGLPTSPYGLLTSNNLLMVFEVSMSTETRTSPRTQAQSVRTLDYVRKRGVYGTGKGPMKTVMHGR